jgi:exosortase
MLVVGSLGAELFISRCSFLAVLAGLIVYFAGFEYFRAILFPWAFLVLMFPIPAIIFNQITLPLQLFASRVASWILSLFGVPVLRLGNVIQLPMISLEVADACSGIRSLISLTTLAIIYSYFAEHKSLHRVILTVAAVPIAVAANATRIVATGLLVQYWDIDKASGFAHEFSGWLIFMASLVLLFLLHKAMQTVGSGRSQHTRGAAFGSPGSATAS